MDVTDPRGVRLDAEALRFVVGLGDHEVLRLGEIRCRDVRVVPARVVAVALPGLAVLVEKRLARLRLHEQRRVVAVARGELDRLAIRAREPQRRIRLL